MKCIRCKKEADVRLPNLSACTSCFEKIIEKRIRKEIRQNSLIEKNDSILIVDDSSAESAVMIYLIDGILKDLPVKISIRKQKYSIGDEIKGNFSKIIIPWNTDKEGNYLISGVFENKKLKYLGNFRIKTKTYIKPLLHVLHEETAIFAKNRRLEFSDKHEGEDILDSLEKEYPEIKFSLMKSAERIKGLE